MDSSPTRMRSNRIPPAPHLKDSIRAAESWFSLSRYSSLSELGQKQWGEQLQKRLLIQQLLRDAKQYPSSNPYEELLAKAIDEAMRNLGTDPLGGFSAGIADLLAPVKDLTVGDVHRINWLIDGWYSKLPGRTIEDSMALEALEDPSTSPVGFLLVNLNARDAEILSEFQRWLQQRRANQESPQPGDKLRQVALQEWERCRMLPYLDLRLWIEWSGIHLTEDALIHLMFDDSEHDESSLAHDKIRATKRTCKEYATWTNAWALMSAP